MQFLLGSKKFFSKRGNAEKTEHFSVYSHCFLVNFSHFQKLYFLNEFDFGLRLFFDSLQLKQQLAAGTTVGNKREVPKVFSVKLKMVRRHKIFIRRFNLWRSGVEREAVRQEGHYYLYILKQNLGAQNSEQTKNHDF